MILFEHADYRGDRVELSGGERTDLDRVRGRNWRNRVSSVRIYRDRRFR